MKRQLLLTTIVSLSLTSGSVLWAAYGNNVAYNPDNDDAAARQTQNASKPNVGLPASNAHQNFGISSVEVADMMQHDPKLRPDMWAAQSNDPATEKAIYDYITKHYRKVPKRDASDIALSIVNSSKEFLVDPFLITSLIERESSFRKDAVSYHGAVGLGQIMPMNFKGLKIANGFDIDQNVRGTTQYVRHLMDRWSGQDSDQSLELTLASYAEGPNAIRRQNNSWKEKTGGYIKDIIGGYKKFIGAATLEAKTNDEAADEGFSNLK